MYHCLHETAVMATEELSVFYKKPKHAFDAQTLLPYLVLVAAAALSMGLTPLALGAAIPLHERLHPPVPTAEETILPTDAATEGTSTRQSGPVVR